MIEADVVLFVVKSRFRERVGDGFGHLIEEKSRFLTPFGMTKKEPTNDGWRIGSLIRWEGVSSEARMIKEELGRIPKRIEPTEESDESKSMTRTKARI